MDKLLIEGGLPLRAETAISAAKNAALPLLTAAVLTREPLTLTNVPALNDIGTMLKLLVQMGVKVARDGDSVTLDASGLDTPVAPYELVKTEGYFRQMVDASGRQLEAYPYNSPADLPIQLVMDPAGVWLRIALQLPGRTLHLRVWQANVGRVRLYLLDSNDLLNGPGDRGITARLYRGGIEMCCGSTWACSTARPRPLSAVAAKTKRNWGKRFMRGTQRYSRIGTKFISASQEWRDVATSGTSMCRCIWARFRPNG